MPMHGPAQPGEVLKKLMGHAEVTAFIARLGVDRITRARLLNGRASVSAPMALKLEAVVNTSAKMWLHRQAHHDLWQARQTLPMPLPLTPSAR